jgi:hypothetical protein
MRIQQYVLWSHTLIIECNSGTIHKIARMVLTLTIQLKNVTIPSDSEGI